MKVDEPRSQKSNEAAQPPAEQDTEESHLPAHHSWRPPARIRIKTFGLHWKGDAFLAAEVTRDDGTPVGVRPLGGAVNFGEPWIEALRREFREEVHVELSHIGPPLVIENIFEHEGVTGHEVTFVAEIEFADPALDALTSLEFTESDGTTHRARWYPMTEIRSGQRRLLPAGLETALLGKVRKDRARRQKTRQFRDSLQGGIRAGRSRSADTKQQERRVL